MKNPPNHKTDKKHPKPSPAAPVDPKVAKPAEPETEESQIETEDGKDEGDGD